MSEKINYRICPANPAGHYFDVTLKLVDPAPEGLVVTMPAWIPGSYMIRDFARNVVSISASESGTKLELKKLDKQSWKLPATQGDVEIRYRVYAWDLSVRSAHLDITHGYFNGTSVFLRVVGQEMNPCGVHIDAGDHPKLAKWRVATTLPAVSVDSAGFGKYRADNYELLIDYPVEMGDFFAFSFDVDSVLHEMVITGKVRFDHERLTADLTKICRVHQQMFGAPSPIDRYLFMTMAVGDGYGGLEHRDSTSLMCNRDDLPAVDMETPNDGYRRFLGLCSHEYFHLWNVKRIRPERLKEADLSREVHTELLWFFEGITSYYDELALVRAGCISRHSYLSLIATSVTRVMRGAGRHNQSIAESSFDAWTKFYKQDENAANAIVSYYTKGGLVAFGLDVTIRQMSGGRLSLDDLMRELWLRYGKADLGVPENGIQSLACELLGSDLSDFFRDYVQGTAELPLAEWFDYSGVGYRLRPAFSSTDQGRGLEEEPEKSKKKASPTLGARLKEADHGAEIMSVEYQGAAHLAGLSAGDRVIAIDGIEAKPGVVYKILESLAENESVDIHAFRRDELMLFNVLPGPAASDTCDLWIKSPDPQDRLNLWLTNPHDS